MAVYQWRVHVVCTAETFDIMPVKKSAIDAALRLFGDAEVCVAIFVHGQFLPDVL